MVLFSPFPGNSFRIAGFFVFLNDLKIHVLAGKFHFIKELQFP